MHAQNMFLESHTHVRGSDLEVVMCVCVYIYVLHVAMYIYHVL